MGHRTQITLTDEQYRLLKRESERTGASIAELTRRAITRVYGKPKRRRAGDGFEASFGLWKDRDLDGAEYVEALRRGLGRRLGD